MCNIKTYNIDNMDYKTDLLFDVIFADYIYENKNFDWVSEHYKKLKPNGVFIAMTDFHTSHLFRIFMEDVLNFNFVNHLVWKNEFGNFKKDRFHQCYDDILIYSNGTKWNFFSDKIQIDKATAKSKGLNPSGRETKTATAWIDDITLTTVAKERVKKEDGHLIRWQKPLRLYDRIISPFISDNASILDLFMGSGSLGLWSKNNGCNYVGIENDKEVYDLALKNIKGELL